MRILSLEPAAPQSLNQESPVPVGFGMPLIEVKWFKGRDRATKAKTIELLTKAMCDAVGCTPDAVTVVIQDVERYEWGKAGKPYA